MFNFSYQSNVNITLTNDMSLRYSSLLHLREKRDERREERKDESGGQRRKGRREREKKRERKASKEQGEIHEIHKTCTKLKKKKEKKNQRKLLKLFYKTRLIKWQEIFNSTLESKVSINLSLTKYYTPF